MPPATKLNILICHPSYGGNGGIDSEHPHIREWAVETAIKIAAEKQRGRIGEVYTKTKGDTPVTMVRNKFFTLARELGCHLILSIDSDQSPSKHAHEAGYVPFWDAAFNFIYANYHKGPRMVVAPYVGPQENIYVFGWRQPQNDSEAFSLEQFTRTEASMMSGIQEVAAGPTGLFLMDTRLLDLIEPSSLSKREVLEQIQTGRMSVDDGLWALREGFCYYEWKNQYADEKSSTEDVVLTRDISLAGLEALGYNPLYCAWDSWIGHWKPRNVGKPQRFSADHVGASLRKAVLDNHRANEVIVDLDRLESPYLKAAQNGHVNRIATVKHSNGNGHAELGKRYWSPLPSAMRKVKEAVAGKSLIVDIGPGHLPLPVATEFCGKRDPKIDYGDRPFHELDLSKDRLPYRDGSVDFVYCRHVVEDLQNPGHLLAEIKRIAKAGYIETPSPMCEATVGVNAPAAVAGGRGYPHHRSVVWSGGGNLYVLPKMPEWDHIDLPDYKTELATPELWNAYHFWEGELNYILLENDKDYLLGVDERYREFALAAIGVSREHTTSLFSTATETTTATGRETGGPWHAHGHAPDEHCVALRDLVRSEAYRKDRPLRILEVGSWLGKTAMAMADSLNGSTVHCVDTWEGTPTDCTGKCTELAGGSDKVYEEFLRRIGNRKDKTIFPWRRSSSEAAAMDWPEGFDLIFIDADHSYEAVKADIEGWWRHLNGDGVMIGHDLHVHGYDGVGRAVTEAFGEHGYTAFGFHPQGCMWRANKQDHPDLQEKFDGRLSCAQ